MGAAVIGTVAGYGDYSVEIKSHEVICLPYSERYGTLPPQKMQVSKLISKLTNIPLKEVNELLESGKKITISKGHKSHRDAWDSIAPLSALGMRCEVIAKTAQQMREDTLNEILK